MIDFYDIEFDFPLDPYVYRNLPGHNRPTTPRRTLRQRIKCEDWMSVADIVISPGPFRLQLCPAKILGSWNCFGSNDLRALVARTAPLVLRQLGHPTSDEQLQTIKKGRYRICEVHVTESFHLVNYSQTQFVHQLYYALGPSRHPQWAARGEGFYFNAHNRRVSAYLYDKCREFLAPNHGYDQYIELLDKFKPLSCERCTVNFHRQKQFLAAVLGPRLEFRFGDQFFRFNELAFGQAWSEETAGHLYLKELQRLQLPETIAPQWKYDEAKALLSRAEFSTLRLWHHGETYESLGTPSTLKRHRASIREALGIDIRLPSAKSMHMPRPLRVRSVFEPDNMVKESDLDICNEELQERMYRAMCNPQYRKKAKAANTR